MQGFQRACNPSVARVRSASLPSSPMHIFIWQDMSFSSDTALVRRAVLERTKDAAAKYRYTTEAFAKLHALHVKRTYAGRDDNSPNRPNVDERMEAVLQRLGVRDNRGVAKMKQKLVDVARRRADSKINFRPKANGLNGGNLDDTHRKIEEKQRQVQEKVNRAVALGWLCDEYIDLISAFRTESANALSGMLEDERNRLAGHVDVLLASTLRPSAKLGEQQRQLFETEVRNIIGSKKMTICEDVKDLVERVAASEEILRTSPTLIREKGVDSGFGDQYSEDWNASTQKNRRVLERKGKKAEYGFEIAKDIGSLLEHCKILR
ncbi:hypothetical protein GALMADRAFT_243042 [Galerina marginata CBS 339.88]|uniref:Uncharacterized protein n=1 Tax=Galerina marginata (strain CBS 339.88) TaxID=685588 RepID=A0A067TJJ9_GALM3|nr:hypothetical protein GALMADRAFT_243042 [Galerina marginata CBS 339.88]